VTERALSEADPDGQMRGLIGPGRVVLIVGASGAGKDTLIGLVRAKLAGHPLVSFPKRSVTRTPDVWEDSAPMSVAEFERERAEGGFAVCWTAHGLGYAYDVCIDGDVRAGRTVVLNVSRTVIGATRARYFATRVVLIEADRETRRQRLSARNRETLADIDGRIAREVTYAPGLVDFVVTNNGEAGVAAQALAALLV
jgi:ribose 1,5-bisphosphokinase